MPLPPALTMATRVVLIEKLRDAVRPAACVDAAGASRIILWTRSLTASDRQRLILAAWRHRERRGRRPRLQALRPREILTAPSASRAANARSSQIIASAPQSGLPSPASIP